jgi:hypothetical protein
LEAIAASAADDASDALDEDEHLPRDDDIIQDILGLESSEEESSDDESRFDCPTSPVDFGINPYNDDVAVNNDLDDVMPSLAYGVLLFSATTGAVARNGGASAAAATTVTRNGGASAAAAATTVTRNVGAAAVVGPNIDAPVGADAVQRLPSGQIKQRQERDCDMAVAYLSYKQRLQSARARIASKIGHKVTVKQGSGSGRQKKEIEWEVVKEHVSTEENQQYREYIGLTALDLESIDDEVIFTRIFLHLFCEDIDEMTARVNAAIREYNCKKRFCLGNIKQFTTSEIIIGFALMIGGGEAGGNGCMMWRSERKQREKVFRQSILKVPDFVELGMPYWRFEQFRKFSPAMWKKKEMEGTDEWWQGISMTDEFNKRRKKLVSASREKTADESMCAMRPRTTKLGGCPHISYILRKPEPLGTEFKKTCCAITGVLMTLEIQRAKEHIQKQKYNKDFRATTGVCLRLVEAADPKDGLKEYIKGDAWFGSVRACAAVGEKGHKAFLQIKGNKGLYPKVFIEEQMASTPGGTSIVLKGTYPNGVPLVAIGYQYITQTTLYFVMTEDAGECCCCCCLFVLFIVVSPTRFIVAWIQERQDLEPI